MISRENLARFSREFYSDSKKIHLKFMPYGSLLSRVEARHAISYVRSILLLSVRVPECNGGVSGTRGKIVSGTICTQL